MPLTGTIESSGTIQAALLGAPHCPVEEYQIDRRRVIRTRQGGQKVAGGRTPCRGALKADFLQFKRKTTPENQKMHSASSLAHFNPLIVYD